MTSTLERIKINPSDLEEIVVSEQDRTDMHNPTHFGRYRRYVKGAERISSEFETARRRMFLMTEYVIELSDLMGTYSGDMPPRLIDPIDEETREAMRDIYRNFSEKDFLQLKLYAQDESKR